MVKGLSPLFLRMISGIWFVSVWEVATVLGDFKACYCNT